MSDIDTLLDSTLDDLEDLPEFKPFPEGAHKVAVTLASKEVNNKPCIEMEMKAIETLELSNTDEAPLNAGDTATVLFMLDNEFGRGNLKKLAKPLGEALGVSSIRDVVEQTSGVECVVITSIRKDRNDPDKKYTNVKELAVA